ncbi:unnamed protein product [Rotaria socialis]|uniref:Uncharacterized protein n=1 Tax=Rotaria socialis TaxID=392032 RepID=A0A820XJH9_9BILA|nr:unnamed protein product [Rotaria socialis]CAF3355435.1 unnamed protein product [Rotaria socialis]CAF3609023.1 unnamed protein product [Rotaria socialis]CAF4534146.1 unnamed protein product [Rotaria socialis]CAF4552986.1 unnamed protein product [Rotaria socialis]
MRNNLAHLLSASQLQEVQECHATNQIAVRRNSQNAEDLINDEKACRVHDTLMLPTVKGNFYNLYLVLFPLQVVIIFAILLQKMFTEEYTVESCESFMVIYNKSDQKPYYDCWVSGEPDLIVNHCSSNISIDDFTYYNIDCAQYYFQASTLFEGVILGYSAHLLLSKVIIFFIRFAHFVTRRLHLGQSGGCCKSFWCYIVPCCSWCIVLFLPFIIILVIIIFLIVYSDSGDARETIDTLIHSKQKWVLLMFSAFMITLALCFFPLAMLTNDLTDDYPSCLTHVSRVTIQARTGVPGNNADITVYSQPPSSYTRGFRSLNESESA